MIDRLVGDAGTPVGPARWDVGVNYHACEGKQTCIEVCPTDVFVLQKTRVKHPLFRLKITVHGGMQAVPGQRGCLHRLHGVRNGMPGGHHRRPGGGSEPRRMRQVYDGGAAIKPF